MPCSAQLPADWDAQRIYDNHEVMMLHGQRCCYFRNPACGRCTLLDLCPTGQRRMAPGKQSGRMPAPIQSATRVPTLAPIRSGRPPTSA